MFKWYYPVSGGVTMASTPDLTFGNNLHSGTPKLDFIMATSFINNSGIVEVDFFDIHYTAWGTFTVTFNSSQTVTTVMGETPLKTTHIDVVANHNVAAVNHLPSCNNYFLVFDIDSSVTGGCTGGHDVRAAYGSLNAYTLGAPVDVTISAGGTRQCTDNEEPDVAGIQKAVGGGILHDQAVITYVNQGQVEFYASSWDPIAGSFPMYTFYPDSYSIPFSRWDGYYTNPRIDANDDFATNANPANANFKIAIEYYDVALATTEVKTADNIAAPPPLYYQTSNWMGGTIGPLFSCSPTSYNSYLPAVAFGPNGTNNFMVTEYVEDQCGGYFL